MALTILQRPSEKIETYVRYMRFAGSVCGIDIFHEGYRMNWITYTLFLSIFGYFLFIFLTIHKYFQEDWKIILRASVTMGTAMQGVSKLYSFISGRATIQELLKLFVKIYKDYETKGDRYRKALEAALKTTGTGVILLTPVYIIGSIGMICLSLIFGYIQSKRYLIFEFEVPGLDVHTNFGYYTTLTLQMILVIVFAFGLFCGDVGALVYLLQSCLFANIFSAKVEDLNEMIEDPENSKKPTVTKALIDIIEWMQLYSEYTSKLNNVLYYIITVQIFTGFYSTVLSIYLIMEGGWPGAYTYFLLAYGCLLLYCILGTVVESANLQFETDVYALHWYNLNVPQQKMVLQLLVMSQNPQIIDISGMAPLSVTTALSLTKTVYSITMCMIRFLRD